MKKKLFSILIMLTLLVSFSVSTASASSFQYKDGDVLITSSTAFKGLTGHAGIVGRSADGKLYVVHIGGYGQQIKKLTLAEWNKNYPKTEVLRYSDATKAKQAGLKAMDFVRYYGGLTGYSADYSLHTSGAWNRTNKDEMYCSKLVWQSYYYGPGLNLGYNPNVSGLITPYSLKSAAGFTKVYGSLK